MKMKHPLIIFEQIKIYPNNFLLFFVCFQKEGKLSFSQTCCIVRGAYCVDSLFPDCGAPQRARGCEGPFNAACGFN